MSEQAIIQLHYPFKNLWPIFQRFGENPGAYAYPCRPDRSHSGIDYACPIGTPFLAAADGIVTKAGWDTSGYGVMIKIAHGMWGETLYGHAESLAVAVGDTVRAGDLIGASGNTGNSTGPHLHFEFHRPPGDCKHSVDPTPYFTAPPDRPGQPNDPPKDQADLPAGDVHTILTTAGLHVRIAPDHDGKIIGILLAGDRVVFCGDPITDGGITWQGIKVWIASKRDGEAYVE